MKSLIYGQLGNLSNAGTRYAPVSCADNVGWSGFSTESSAEQIMSSAGTIRNLRVKLATAPGSGKSWTIAVRKNGATTAVTVTISNTDTEGLDSSNEVTYAAGDRICLIQTSSATPTQGKASWCLEYEGDTANESQLLGSTANAIDGYYGFGWTIGSATEIQASQLIATPGTIKKLYVRSASALGDGGTFTVYKNGVATALTCSIASSGQTANDSSNSFTVVAGDLISFRTNIIGANPIISFGCTFTATTDGEFPVMAGCSNDPDATSVEYGFLNMGNNETFTATESVYNQVTSPVEFSDIYAKVTTAPGTSKTLAITLRADASDTELSAVITDPATTANDTGSVVLSAYQMINIETTPTGGNTPPGEIHWGLTGAVVEAGASGYINLPLLAVG